MDCKKINVLLVDFIDKTLDENRASLVRSHIENCKTCREEVEQLAELVDELNKISDEIPDSMLRQRLIGMIGEEKKAIAASKHPSREIMIDHKAKGYWFLSPVFQIAAGFALLIAGVLIGLLINSGSGQNNEVLALRGELNQVKQMMIMAKLEQPSASQRIYAAKYTQDFVQPEAALIYALIETMNTDENVNVRMAAIHALAKYRSDTIVRDALVNSLDIQTDPLLQITLINTLVDMREMSAVDKMKKLIEDENTYQTVKELAEKGVARLI